MGFRLVVSHDLVALAGVLAGELANPLADPFTAEVVAVPGDGVRAWLVGELARHLGAADSVAGDGIVANVRFVFPSTLVRDALGVDQHEGAWGVGPLTWAIHRVLPEVQPDATADLMRARAVADLFDRYALHRPAMVRAWESGRDVDSTGRPLEPHQVWQPQLWRRVQQLLGGRSDAQALTVAARELADGRREPLLPERVFLFGLASLPAPHLTVLSALAQRRSVQVLAPAHSTVVWQRVVGAARQQLVLPLARGDDPTARSVRHPLAVTWARASREAHLLLAATALDAGAVPELLAAGTSEPVVGPPTLLARVQAGLRADVVDLPLAGQPLVPDDRSLWWHRCHGEARQVEVLRDEVLRLLQTTRPGGGTYLPRDIIVLCPDPAVFAPLVESVFAGDPAHGLPAIPVQVADRSMRADNPLLDAVGALLALLDGRFRAGDVLAFAARPPVSRALGLSAVHLDRMTEWAEGTHVRWGLDAASHRQFGVPADLAAHTWQAGLDQLLVGATMAGPAFGPGRTVPWPDIEGDDVEILGAVAELIARLRVAYRSLGRPMPPGEFLGALAEAASSLFAVSDADSWQWRDLTRLLDELRLDTEIGAASPQPVATDEMVALVSQRLVGRPGRPRFDSGAVTLSSLTAQRGVPRPVICLVGLDGDVGSAAALAADDLTTQPACVGDRDTRSELRAQLLDALLAAGERVVICANGHDLRTNADVPPSVPVAELCDLLDASAVPSGARRVSEQVSTAHPRQAWSTENFVPGALGVPGAWSFDRVGHDAASARRSQVPRGPLLVTPLVPDHVPTVTIADLVGTLRNPVETLLRQRLGLWIDREGEVAIDHLVPLGADALHRWGLANDLLARRMSAPPAHGPTLVDEWAEVQRRRGAVPPLGFGDGALDGATAQVDALLDALTRSLAGVLEGAPPVLGARTVELGLDGVLPGAAGSSRSITGEIGGIVGHVVVEVTPSRLKPSNRLIAWLHLACLTRQHPEVDWEAVVIGRASNDKVVTERVRLRSAHAAGTALAALVELHDQARCQLIPALPKTAEALARGDLDAAFDAWDPTAMFAAEGADRWVRFALGASDLHDLLDPESPLHCPHLVPWATRLWTAYRETTFEGDEWDRD